LNQVQEQRYKKAKKFILDNFLHEPKMNRTAATVFVRTAHALRDLTPLFSPLLDRSTTHHQHTVDHQQHPALGVIVLGGALPASTRHFAQSASVLVLGDSGADGMRRIDSNLQYDEKERWCKTAPLTMHLSSKGLRLWWAILIR
jgi:hypothetical protein